MQALLNGKSKFNAQPRLLVTPGYSSTLAVATELVALGDKMRAMAIIDGPNTTDEAAIAYAGNFGSKHAYMVDPGVQFWDTGTSHVAATRSSARLRPGRPDLFAWKPMPR